MTTRKLRFSSALTADGWKSDVMISIDPEGMIESVSGNSKEGNLIKGIAVPAVPNVHSHAHQRLMLGLAEKAGPGTDSFWTWRDVMYGFALKLGPDDMEAVAAQLYVEMLKAGFSIVGEFQYLHHQPDGSPYGEVAEMSLRCVAAAEKAGIAITMLPTLYNYGGFGGQPSAPGQRRFVNDATRYLRIYGALAARMKGNPLMRLGISPHSMRAVTDELLREVLAGIDPACPVHIHIAEQRKEVEDCVSWSGRRPVQLLLENHDVSDRWCAIHATHMTEAETDALARSGCIAGLCPTTEANLGDGIFPATAFARARGAYAIGSDSHISVSPAEDLRQLEYSQRLRDLTRNSMAAGPGLSTGRTMFDAVLKGGARSMNQPVGVLAPKFRADICVLDGEHPSLAGRSGEGLLDTWIFSGGNSCVKDMFVAGRHVVQERHHVDEEAIEASFRQAVRRLS